MTMDNKRVVVAMSGGVDSTAVAALLKKEGYDVIGITMQLLDYGEAEGGCCSLDQVVDARRAAEQLGFPHYVVNYTEEFNKYVLTYYVDKYRSGKTPIPCVLCNKHIKFDLLLRRALELGAEYLATGHYARIRRDESSGKLTLNKARDASKDQTYFLHTLTERELGRLMFPIGDMTKDEVRDIAKSFRLRQAEKPDSTGVCFVPDGNYRDYLTARAAFALEKGKIVNTRGDVLGNHEGVFSFTVGQRRGLGIATGKPMYVTRIEPESNRVIVGEEGELYKTKLIVESITWVDNTIKVYKIDHILEVKAKIRYRHPESVASLRMWSRMEGMLEFKDPQRAITPGQAVVFYRGDEVLGGGWIREVLPQ
ncbi:MAG: tRNA 2-thiouridine(34) synthase MnmA [Thermodesulfobacteriota bacterium]